MKAKSAIERLLADVLALQDEDGGGAGLAEERVRHVLLGRDTFTADEENILLTSPLARATYAEVLEDVQIEREAFRHRIEIAGIEPATAVLLAASGGPYPMVIPSEDFSVTVRSHPLSKGWVITLTLRDRFRQIIHSEDVLALVDDQDVTWLRGQMNSYGEIHSYDWPYDGTPVERMQRSGFALRVQHG
jgi:hypothetical protein